MPQVSDIDGVSITLKIDGKQSLFILLAADGTINRLGTGAVNNRDKDLFIGRTDQPLLKELLTTLSESSLEHMGGYDVPEKKGALCELTIALSFTNAENNGFAIRYGSESQGPPHEIVEFVRAAVDLTDPWFQEQKQMVRKAKSNSNKPWWQFWGPAQTGGRRGPSRPRRC